MRPLSRLLPFLLARAAVTQECFRSANLDPPFPFCKGQARVCPQSPDAPRCVAGMAPSDSQRYVFYTFPPNEDIHVSAWLHKTGGFYDVHQHFILDYALKEHNPKHMVGNRSLRPIVLDVGSNLGTLTLYAAATRCCSVHAFELQYEVATLLSMSVGELDVSQRSRTFVHHTAVSDGATRNVSYDSQPSNPGGVGLRTPTTSDQRTVQTVALDTIFHQSLTPRGRSILMLKIDTEGHELSVLLSARKLLQARAIRHMMIEVRAAYALDILNLVYGFGYVCTWAQPSPILALASPFLPSTFHHEIATISAFRDLHCFHARKWPTTG